MLRLLLLIGFMQAFTVFASINGDTSDPLYIEKINDEVRGNIDSMLVVAQNIVDGKGDGSLQLHEAYYIIGYIASGKHDFQTSFEAYKSGLEYAKQAKDSVMISYMAYRLGSIYFQIGEPQTSDSLFHEAYRIAKEFNHDLTQLYALNGMGLNATELGNLEKALDYFDEGIPIARKLNLKDLEWVLVYGKLECYTYLSTRSNGYEAGIEALKIANELSDTVLIAKSNLGIAVVLMGNEEYDSAIEYFQEAYNYFEYRNMTYWKGIVAINLTEVFLYENKEDLTLQYAKIADSIFVKMGAIPQIISSYNNLGAAYSHFEQYDSALSYYHKSIELALERDLSISIYTTYLGAGKCYFSIKDYAKAIEYGEKGLKLIDEVENSELKFDYYDFLHLVYKEVNNTTEALKYSELMLKAYLEDKNIKETKKIAQLEAEYKYEREKAQLEAEQNALNLKNEREIANKERLIKISITIIGLISIIVFLLIRLYRNKRRDNALLEDSNKSIKDQAEKLKELDLLKSRFFTNISHEFRTPLTLIKGPVEKLMGKYDGNEDKSLFESISKNTDRLLNLINQILELAELQSRRIDLKLSKTNSNEFFQRIVGAFESLSEMRDIDLSVTVQGENHEVYIEQESIEKSLVNLLSNAFKFTKNGGSISVDVEVENKSLIIKVSDTGRGISPEELENIFEMFYYTESDQSASSGIGLALINELIKNHHGKIEVNSKLNEGTTFTLIIPCTIEYYQENEIGYDIEELKPAKSQVIEIDDIQDTIDVSDEANQTGKGETVLIIEDNVEIRSFMKGLLSDMFNVVEAEDGEIGVVKAFETIPDLIVSDVMMPKKDGFSVAKELKEDERTSHIPVMLLTARGDKESKLQGLSTKADDYLVKPFEQNEFMARINNLIANRKKVHEKFGKGIIEESGKIDLPSIDQIFIEKVKKVIEENLEDSDFSVDQLAKEVGVSRSQLHRKMVGLSGKSTSIFIRNIRLKKAYVLLENRTATISEISDQVGFSSPSYFNKCFKELYGSTPKQVMQKAETQN